MGTSLAARFWRGSGTTTASELRRDTAPSSGRSPPPPRQTPSAWTVSLWLAPMVSPRPPPSCATLPTSPSPTSAPTASSPSQFPSDPPKHSSLNSAAQTSELKDWVPSQQFSPRASNHLCWESTLLPLALQSPPPLLQASTWITLRCHAETE